MTVFGFSLHATSTHMSLLAQCVDPKPYQGTYSKMKVLLYKVKHILYIPDSSA